MRMKVPLTGKAIDFDPELASLDKIGVSGDENDPIRVDVNLGNVSWKLISIDLEAQEAEIEVTPANIIEELKPGGDPEKTEDFTTRQVSNAEKQSFLNVAQQRADAAPRGQLKVTSTILNKYKNWKTEKVTLQGEEWL